MNHYMIVDCESIGIHGETFAVGWVIVDGSGQELESGYEACPPISAQGTEEDGEWVQQNVVPHLPPPEHPNPFHVRLAFWNAWQQAHKDYSFLNLVADCLWPVEARFLRDCVADFPEERKWSGPYPFHEIATMFLTDGRPPTAHYPRLPEEEPAHHPTCDARQSARLFIEAMRKIRSSSTNP